MFRTDQEGKPQMTVFVQLDPRARSSLRSRSRRRYTMPFATSPRRQPICTKRR